MDSLIYRRILLKLSGEALLGHASQGIDPEILNYLAAELKTLRALGIQIAVVIGGGNFLRGAGLAANGMDRVTADHMGMLATLMNALALQDALEKCGVAVRLLSALKIAQIGEEYERQRAIRHLESGQIVLCAAGTGNPFFTTDTAASLRAIEIKADLLIKATKVAGIYSADPVRDPTAIFYPRLSYEQALQENLQIMDTTALILCRDHRIPLRVLKISEPNVLINLIQGADIGSLVTI